MANRSDNFNRADGALIGSTPSDGGSVWQQEAAVNGTWVITGNQAADTDSSGSTNRFALLQSNASDFELTCTLPVVSSDGGFVFRWADTTKDGFLLAVRSGTGSNRLQLYQWTNGSDDDGDGTSIDSSSTTVSNGSTIKITAVGTAINIYLNDNLVISTTSSWQQTGTRHGFRSYNSNTAARWDNLVITDLSATPVSVDFVTSVENKYSASISKEKSIESKTGLSGSSVLVLENTSDVLTITTDHDIPVESIGRLSVDTIVLQEYKSGISRDSIGSFESLVSISLNTISVFENIADVVIVSSDSILPMENLLRLSASAIVPLENTSVTSPTRLRSYDLYGCTNYSNTDTGTQGGSIDTSITYFFSNPVTRNVGYAYSAVSDAADTIDVTITGRLTSGASDSEIITLNGATPVLGTKEFLSISKVTSEGHLGVITISGGDTEINLDIGVLEARRLFDNVRSDGTSKIYYEKVFIKNNTASTLSDASVSEVDADGYIDFALEDTINGSNTSDSRLSSPSDITAFSSSQKSIGALAPDDYIGVWIRLVVSPEHSSRYGIYGITINGNY